MGSDIHGKPDNLNVHGNPMDTNIHGNRPMDVHGNSLNGPSAGPSPWQSPSVDIPERAPTNSISDPQASRSHPYPQRNPTAATGAFRNPFLGVLGIIFLGLALIFWKFQIKGDTYSMLALAGVVCCIGAFFPQLVTCGLWVIAGGSFISVVLIMGQPLSAVPIGNWILSGIAFVLGLAVLLTSRSKS